MYPCTSANTLLIPGLSLGQQAATPLSALQSQAPAGPAYANSSQLSIYALGKEDIATDFPGFSQYGVPDAPHVINYIQTPVNFLAQQMFSHVPHGIPEFHEMFSPDHDANPMVGNSFVNMGLQFNAQRSLQNHINEVRDSDMVPMPVPSMPASGPSSELLEPTQFRVPVLASTPALAPSNGYFICTNCDKTFKRHSDCIRHENSIHANRFGAHLCPIAGCVKARGKGFSRSDKVTEHLWKCHGNLGFLKRA